MTLNDSVVLVFSRIKTAADYTFQTAMLFCLTIRSISSTTIIEVEKRDSPTIARRCLNV